MKKRVSAFLMGLLLVLSSEVPTIAAEDVTTIVLQDSNGAGIANVEIWAYASATGTELRIKTDTNGVARLQALRGKGSFQINHCKQSASSIALQIFDVDYGNGGQSFTIKLPSRQRFYDYNFVDSSGSKIQAVESIGLAFTPFVNSWMQDYGTFVTPLGTATISSCGSAWFSDEILRVAPFASSSAEPAVAVAEKVVGGNINRLYLISEFTENGPRTLTVNNFTYIAIQPEIQKVYPRQMIKVTGKFKGLNSISEISEFAQFRLSCASKSGSAIYGPLSKANDDLSISSTVSFQAGGSFRCILASFGRDNLSSYAFPVEVLPLNAFNSAVKKKYNSCAALNKFFEGGIAKSSKAQSADQNARFMPIFSASGYKLNASLDKDKDGIACER